MKGRIIFYGVDILNVFNLTASELHKAFMLINKWSNEFDTRSHRCRTWTV